MKKHDYYITNKKKPTVEAFKDAEGNIIIPSQYLIKESDTNEEKGKKKQNVASVAEEAKHRTRNGFAELPKSSQALRVGRKAW